MDLDVVLYSRFTRLESIAISIYQSATEAHEYGVISVSKFSFRIRNANMQSGMQNVNP